MAKIIHSLDIGTDSIKILSCSIDPKSSHLKMLAFNSLPCFGVRKGVVVDVEKVSNYIRQLVDKQVQSIGREIDDVYANINGHHIFVVPSHGTVAISRADQIISQEDEDRVIQAAEAISLPSNKNILAVFTKDFIIDGEKGIKDPLGMKGIRLEADVLALCGFTPYIKNLYEAILNSGIKYKEAIVSPLAAARAVLTPQQKELGVAVLDIGASTIGLAVFEEGDLIHLAVLPLGSFNITKDIAIGLKTRIDIAEEIKQKFGLSPLIKKSKLTRKKNNIQINKDLSSPLNFNFKELKRVVEPRIDEMFAFVNKELKKIGRQKQLPAGVVITGGGAKLSGIVEVAKEKLKLPVSIGLPKGITGLPKDTSLSVVAGLSLLALDNEEESPSEIGGRFANFFRKIFKVFIP